MLSAFTSCGGARFAPTGSVEGRVSDVRRTCAPALNVIRCSRVDRRNEGCLSISQRGATHLQSDGPWEAGESPGAFVSLLAKHALLSPRSRLSVRALLGDQGWSTHTSPSRSHSAESKQREVRSAHAHGLAERVPSLSGAKTA